MSEREPIVVHVDPDLADLVPGFLERRRADVEKIGAAIEAEEYEEARRLAHSMRGTGGSYGFTRLSELGAAMETAAKASDGGGLAQLLAELEDYLARIEVR